MDGFRLLFEVPKSRRQGYDFLIDVKSEKKAMEIIGDRECTILRGVSGVEEYFANIPSENVVIFADLSSIDYAIVDKFLCFSDQCNMEDIALSISQLEDEIADLYSKLQELEKKRYGGTLAEMFEARKKRGPLKRKITKRERQLQSLIKASNNDKLKDVKVKDVIRECGKKTYTNKRAAQRKAKRLKELSGNRNWRSYQCNICGSFHITKQGKRSQ